MLSLPTLDERIKKETEKLELLKRQRRAMIARENKITRAIEKRQNELTGEAFLAAFPEYRELRPQRTTVENQQEFEPLYYFLHELSADKEYVTRCKAEADRKMANK